MQTDPIGYEDQMNLYAYVANDPVGYIDPTGEALFAIPAIPWAAGAIKAALFTGSAAAVAYGASEAVDAYNESSESTRELGDLETIHDPDHVQNDPEIGGLSDEELGEAINNPENGDKVTVRGNKVLDGNTRVNEAKARGWEDDTEVPVDEIPELPDNIDDDPLGPYGG